MPGRPFTVSIQKVEVTSAETAFGPCAGVPCRNAVLEVPPPTTGRIGCVETLSVVVFRTVSPVKAVVKTEFGLFTIAWVMPTISAGGDRKADGMERFDSGNWIF